MPERRRPGNGGDDVVVRLLKLYPQTLTYIAAIFTVSVVLQIYLAVMQ